MSLVRWQATIVNESGDVQAAASVEIRNSVTGALVTVASDEAGTPKGNPFIADGNGFAFGYIPGGNYDIAASLGLFSITWSDVPVFGQNSAALYIDSATLFAGLSFDAGQVVNTRGYSSANGVGSGSYLTKTAAQAASDGDAIDEIGAGFTLDNGNVAVLQVVSAVNIQQFGAVADGVDSLDGGIFTGNWEVGVAYAVGDIVQAPTNLRGYKCISAHTSVNFTIDIDSWELGHFTGTANNSFIESAILSNRPVYMPSGKYRLADINVLGTLGVPLIDLTSKPDVFFYGDGDTSQLLVDENCAERIAAVDYPSQGVFGTGDNFVDPVRGKYGSVVFKDFLIKSRWSHFPGTNNDGGPNGNGINFFIISEYDKVTFDNVTMTDARQKVCRNWNNETVKLINCLGERLSKGMFREVNSNNIICTGNRVFWSGDDSLDFVTAVADGISADQLAGNSVICSNNIVTDGEGIICSGFSYTTITNNILNRPVDTCITVVTNTPNMNPTKSITITGNKMYDGLRPIDAATGMLLTSSIADNPYIAVKGGTASTVTTGVVRPGDFDAGTGLFILPYGANTQGSYLHTKQYQEESSSRGFAVDISDNHVLKTLPSGVNFSAWLGGMMFSPSGFYDPVIADTNRLRTGVIVQDELDDASVFKNKIIGIETPVYLKATVFRDASFGFVDISNNIFRDFKQGFSHTVNGGGTLYNYRVSLHGNVFDADPYHLDALRTSPLDGSWQAPVSVLTDCCGVRVRNISADIQGNVFRNCMYPVANGDTTSPASASIIINNVVESEASAVGYSVSNLGVGVVPSGDQMIHTRIGSDPTRGDFGDLINMPRLSSVSLPTNGYYVAGHIVKKSAPSSTGAYAWLRITTGNAHVLGVDWTTLSST